MNVFRFGQTTLYRADARAVVRCLPDASIDAVVTDPPYGLDFMGRAWDGKDSIAFAVAFWAEVFRVLKPGGHIVAFSGTRTYHRLAVAIEDAGFEIRDQLAWVYGSGFPKSLDVSKAINKAASATDAAKQWAGWGTALKPAWEPIVLARKPLIGTVVENVLMHGTGGLNIDGCRVDGSKPQVANVPLASWRNMEGRDDLQAPAQTYDPTQGRFPANLVHDGSPEVLAGFPQTTSGGRTISAGTPGTGEWRANEGRVGALIRTTDYDRAGDSGSAARFFYCAKASKKDRAGSKHPTIKPVALMRWLVRLVTPPGGTVLEPFAGSGSTLQAAIEEGASVIGIEREAEFYADCIGRILPTCLF